MEIKTKDIKYYVTEDGHEPYIKWFKGIKNLKGRALIKTRLNRVRSSNFGDYKPVKDGVYELRIHYGPGYRIYYGLDGDSLVILLCGGLKGTQSKDIKKALQYWDAYKEEKKNAG